MANPEWLLCIYYLIMTTEDFKAISDTVPRQPGVYRFLDKTGTILYVGKAKVLRNRVASYFGQRKGRAHKTRVMVKNASRIEITVVDTEADALLLENTLIKKHQPLLQCHASGRQELHLYLY